MHDPTDDVLLLRIKEVARLVSLGQSKVRELIASGELGSVRIGRAVRVPRRALLAWLDEAAQHARAGS